MGLIISVRVYGILVNDARQVLVSDEYIRGSYYTKFPGGGLEIGEGTRDCLKREFKEEMNLEVAIGDHIYTVTLRNKEFDFDERQLQLYSETQQIEAFRFVDWEKFSADTVTLPIDKIVATMVKEKF